MHIIDDKDNLAWPICLGHSVDVLMLFSLKNNYYFIILTVFYFTDHPQDKLKLKAENVPVVKEESKYKTQPINVYPLEKSMNLLEMHD